jgi:hypothetical protein
VVRFRLDLASESISGKPVALLFAFDGAFLDEFSSFHLKLLRHITIPVLYAGNPIVDIPLFNPYIFPTSFPPL